MPVSITWADIMLVAIGIMAARRWRGPRLELGLDTIRQSNFLFWSFLRVCGDTLRANNSDAYIDI
jgi:hypothetical protein